MKIGWIDFSRTDRERIMTLMHALTEPGTLDNLGIAPIRDGFSDLFFPGTSTIQTRAKYFFLVPYIFKDLEFEGVPDTNALYRALNAKEKDCCRQLLEKDPSTLGIIGSLSLRNDNWVRRPPSEIYWSGLRRYQISLKECSISEYLKYISQHRKGKVQQGLGNRNDNQEEADTDDINAGSSVHYQLWNMPLYQRNWKDHLSIRLTPEEGLFLKEQIEQSCPSSLLGQILKKDMRIVTEIPDFQSLLPYMDSFSDTVKYHYMLANQFSLFYQALITVYDDIVSDGTNDNIRAAIEQIQENSASITSLNIDQIVGALAVSSNPKLINFLKECQATLQSRNMDELQRLIKMREISLKGESRAKTCHPGETDMSNWRHGEYLEYRFHNAVNILKDIFKSQEGVSC